MDRHNYVESITRALGDQPIIWFGTRGCDALPLLDLPNLHAVYSLISSPAGWPGLETACLEDLTGLRVDLDSYSIDNDTSPAISMLRDRLSTLLDNRCLLVPYRPYAFLTSVIFPQRHLTYAGLFHERQSSFEHKPWVESELRRRGIKGLDWTYFLVRPQSLPLLRERLHAGPVVLRLNRSNGGNGLFLVADEAELERRWAYLATYRDGFCSVAPFYSDTVPLSINACVFPDGAVRQHGASIQVVGDPQLSDNPFAYCGNDFGRVKDLERHHIDALETLVDRVGHWLAEQQFVGMFGIDAMIVENSVCLVEINPRFQGSSSTAAALDRKVGRIDAYLEHIGAFLGIPPPPRVPLRELIAEQPKLTHLIIRNRGTSSPRVHVPLDAPGAPDVHACSVLPPPQVRVAPNAIICRYTNQNSLITPSGRLTPEAARTVGNFINSIETNAGE